MIRAALLLGSLGPGRAGAAETSAPVAAPAPPPVQMDSVNVSADTADINASVPEITYDSDYMKAVGATSVSDFLESLPQNLTGANAPLILVNGHRTSAGGQTFIDLKAIPPAMIERIEFIQGGDAIYGPEGANGVLNIILKKNYLGHQITLTDKGTFGGGGNERRIDAVSGFTAGKLSGTVSLTYSTQENLLASQRSFSANEDHRGRGGQDFRLPYGNPATVVAVNGSLNGVSDASGNPDPVALTPTGQAGRGLVPAQFSPGLVSAGGLILAGGQRTYNAAADLTMVPASERLGGAATLNFNPNGLLSLFTMVAASSARSTSLAPPPVTSAATTAVGGIAAPVVPAADNPFGQDVAVGLVHTEFGPLRHSGTTASEHLIVGGRDTVTQGLDLEADVSVSNASSRSGYLDLDKNAFAASLANPDPALRFNPFGDPALGPVNADLYHNLAVYRASDSTSRLVNGEVTGRDQLPAFWGGQTILKFGIEARAQDFDTDYLNPANLNAVDTDYHRKVAAGDGSLWVPLFGPRNAKPLIRRFTVFVGGRYEDDGSVGIQRTKSAGIAYQPIKALTLRCGTQEGTKPPPLPTLESQTTTVTLVDPRREPSTTTDVDTFTNANPSLLAEQNQTTRTSLEFKPPFVKGLEINLEYKDTRQTHLSSSPDAQSIVYNESFFGSRVVRAPQTAQDAALGQPGAILAVDTTPGSFGDLSNQSLNYELDWSSSPGRWGKVRVITDVTRTLHNSYDLAPGVPYVSDTVGAQSPPDWRAAATLVWQLNPWSLFSKYSYTGHFSANNEEIGNFKTLDFYAAYIAPGPIWRHFGKGATLGVGIGNVFGANPPFADTLLGFLSGSPNGRIFQVNATVPF